MAGPASTLLGVIRSVCGGFINYFADRATRRNCGIAGYFFAQVRMHLHLPATQLCMVERFRNSKRAR